MLMRQCGWSLLMGEARVFNIRQLREHFDAALVTGYLLGGTLERWLAEAGETEILTRVGEIDYSADLGGQLEFIFGVRPEKKTELPENILKALSARKKTDPPKTAFCCSSFKASSFRSGSARTSSGSFRLVRFYGSGYGHVGSWRSTSWHVGSWRNVYWRSAFWYAGSWHVGSWRAGSGYMFRTYLGSASWRGGSWKTGSGGSFAGLQKGSFGGSFRYFAGETEITEQEYRRTMINLSSCPLNEYGYGIHLI